VIDVRYRYHPDRHSNFVVLLGALYLLSRGASNMLEGAGDQMARQAEKANGGS
jgi:hypothetical protein